MKNIAPDSTQGHLTIQNYLKEDGAPLRLDPRTAINVMTPI